MKKYSILILLFYIAGCTNNDIKLNSIPEKYYSVPIINVNQNSTSLVQSYTRDYVSNISDNGYYETKLKCTSNPNDHIYKGNYVEIEFGRRLLSDPLKFARCFVGINKNNKAFYLYWTNKPYDSITISANTSYKTYWDICEYTDTLFSNLDLEIINLCFKNFNGYFEKKEIKSIFIDNSYFTNEILFYNRIKFDGFDLGYSIYQAMQIDSSGKVINYIW